MPDTALLHTLRSTCLVFVATAALEAGLTHPDEVIDCQMGAITIGGHLFHDHKPYGLLTFDQILEHSSTVGAAKLGLRLGEVRLYQALRGPPPAPRWTRAATTAWSSARCRLPSA